MNLYQHKDGHIISAEKLRRDLIFPRRERKRWFGKSIIIEERVYQAGGYIIWFEVGCWVYFPAERFEPYFVLLG